MVTEFNNTFVGHQSRQVAEHCSTTYGYASAKHILYSENNVYVIRRLHTIWQKQKLYLEAS
jgi:hypothetical protein